MSAANVALTNPDSESWFPGVSSGDRVRWSAKNPSMSKAKLYAKPGPKPKGDRQKRPISLERELWAEVERIAERDNLPLTAIVHRLVAERLGREVPSYCLPKPKTEQEALPMSA